MDAAKDIVEQASRNFREQLTPGLFEKFQGTQVQDLKRQILDFQSLLERRNLLRDFKRINPFIAALEGITDVIPLSHDQTACVWGPVKHILLVVQGRDEKAALDEVLQSYRDLGLRLPSVRLNASLAIEKTEASICLAHMYEDLLHFQRKMLQLFTGYDWRITFHINWKYYHEDSFQGVLKNIDLHRKTLDDLQRAHWSQSSNEHQQISRDMSNRFNNYLQNYNDDRQDLEMHIRNYEEDRQKLLRNAREEETHRKQQQLNDFRKWVSAPRSSQESLHTSFTKIREEFTGTTDWILKQSDVHNWMHEDDFHNSILCITGKKGAGKTILASRIIEHCENKDNGFKTSYFYCREDDPLQNNCLAIYRCLLMQMLHHHMAMLPSCRDKMLRGNEMLNDETVAQSLLKVFCNADMKQYIVIDGIDEVDPVQRKPLLQFFAALVEKCDTYEPGKVRVLFLSHDLPDHKHLKSEVATFMHLNSETIDHEIEKFTAIKAPELKQRLGLTDEEIQSVRKLIVTRSNGMFLFATLVIDNLLQQPTIECAKEQLRPDVFPEDLLRAYGNIIQRLKRHLGSNQWLMAKKIFGWLACAKRPLSLRELQAALSMVINAPDKSVTMDYHNKQLRHDLREICGSLVQTLGNRIVFIHSTAKSHIIESEHLDMKSIECEFTTTSLRYLSSQCFQKDARDEQREQFVLQGCYSFQDYTLAKWGYHIEAIIRAGPDLLAQDCLSNLAQALNEFALVYQSELSIPAESEHLTTQAREECKEFIGYEAYETLVAIRTHFSHQKAADLKERNKVSLPSLAASLELSRSTIESLSSHKDLENVLEEYYGECFFKCDQLTCEFFHEGFNNHEAREKHRQRHKRPYRCSVEGCYVQAFGFSTNKDKEKHMRTYHPDNEDTPTFIQEPREVMEDAKFPCPFCRNKYFTRKANRDAHVRAHNGDRPYVCDICPNKAFVRANDLQRHNRNIHSRRIGLK